MSRLTLASPSRRFSSPRCVREAAVKSSSWPSTEAPWWTGKPSPSTHSPPLLHSEHRPTSGERDGGMAGGQCVCARVCVCIRFVCVCGGKQRAAARTIEQLEEELNHMSPHYRYPPTIGGAWMVSLPAGQRWLHIQTVDNAFSFPVDCSNVLMFLRVLIRTLEDTDIMPSSLWLPHLIEWGAVEKFSV